MMKLVLKCLLAIIAFYTSTVRAQSGYIPIPSDSVEWIVEELIVGEGTSTRYKHHYVALGDTIIDDTTYIQIYDDYDGFQVGLLYQDTSQSKVYWAYPDYKYLLLDFNLEVGEFFFDEFIGSQFQVTEVDTILVAGTKRRRIVFDDIIHVSAPNYEHYCFIEGIGSNAGIFPASYLSKVTSLLTCFKSNYKAVFPLEPFENGCDLDKFINVGNNENKIPDFEVFPNPNESYVFIRNLQSSSRRVQILVFDQLGRLLINENSFINSDFRVDLRTLNPGMHHMQIISDHCSQSIKLIKQ